MNPEAPTAQLPQDPPPSPPPEEPKRLTRSSRDRVLTGVAGGLGRHLDVDPVLVRLGFAVLSLLGGAGVLLYLVLAVVVPADGEPVEGTDSRLATGAIVVLVLLALVTIPFLGGGLLFFAPGLAVLAVVAAVCVLVVRALRGEQASAGRILLALVAVAAAAALGVAAAAGVAFGGGTAVAIVVLALGVALVVAGVLGGARWLVLPALAIAIPSVVIAASGLDLRGGVGSRDVRPAALSSVAPSYRLGVGDLRIDLRGVAFRGVTDVEVSAGMAHVEVLVPEGVCVQTTARTSAGDLDVFGRHTNGIDVAADDAPQPRAGRPTLRLDADVTMGNLVVAHVSPESPRAFDRLDPGVGSTATEQTKACVAG